MATTATKLADKPYAKLAIGATKAIALKLVEAVPVIGPYISVGAKAILDELEKLKQGGDELTSKEVLTWMTNLSPADYETLVLEAIDLEPLVKDNSQKPEITNILLRSKPDINSLVELLEDQETEAKSSYDDLETLNRLLIEEKRPPSPDERRLILRHRINTNNWQGALQEIDQIMKANADDTSLHELDLLVARRHSWTPWAMGGGIAIGFALAMSALWAARLIGERASVAIAQFALVAAIPVWVFLEWLFPRSGWKVRRLLKRVVLIAAGCALLSYLAQRAG